MKVRSLASRSLDRGSLRFVTQTNMKRLLVARLPTIDRSLIDALRTFAMKHVYWLLLILLVSSSALAQTGSLRGQVTDQNGGSVPGAKVTVNGPSGLVKTTNTDKSGSYSFAGLPAGDYDVQASAPNLELAEPVKVSFK